MIHFTRQRLKVVSFKGTVCKTEGHYIGGVATSKILGVALS